MGTFGNKNESSSVDNDAEEIDTNDSSDNSEISQNELFCIIDEDCPRLYICDYLKECIRKPLFPLTYQEILGTILLVIFLGLGQSAGIGGDRESQKQALGNKIFLQILDRVFYRIYNRS
ncbi:hypothetical protein IMG5_055450 [Ichthyophthirius multifiliis]|uniref:Uncharacterized protein n=1 Tax=Ichthyophthirius multifiliis TaxID=5932 RepID=G0QN55_ICHMU|nr:hypothetical protein IMG5_055450 [Ichthyophthirius multifiliis]EGR33349.1 hypothetical protein IMG5_055450 [Ichthyophthirius multifiliis]|eukprot:XP_004037335.1 hypothetical protein IMG5_055450 [Ichthyophthirius multifiliis]